MERGAFTVIRITRALCGSNSQVVSPSCTSSGPEATGLGAASEQWPYQTRSNSLSAILTGSPVCRPRTFSTALANASALAAPACCLSAVLSFSTTEPQSVVAAVRCFRSACLLFTFSTDFAHALWAVGRPLFRSRTGALRGMTTGKFVMGTLARLSIRRWAV